MFLQPDRFLGNPFSRLNKPSVFFVFLCWFALSCFPLFGQDSIFDNQEIPEEKIIVPTDIQWQSFTNYEFYRLSDLLEIDGDGEAEVKFDYQAIVKKLVEETNISVIDALKSQLSDKYKTSDDYEELRRLLLALFREKKQESSVKKTPISKTLGSGGIVLRSADTINYFEKKIGERTEKLVQLRGNVEISSGIILISANDVLINLSQKELYAQDDLLLVKEDDFLQGDRLFYRYEKRQGYISTPRGLLDGQYFKGRVLSINSNDYFTLRDGDITFSPNPDPYYSIYAEIFDNFGQEKWTGANLQFRVGNHPFFWFPFYIAYPLTTGIKLRFGENRREGFYGLMQVDFANTPIDNIEVNFNFYEKLGMYFSFENDKDFDWIKYSLLLGIAVYTDNTLLRDKPNKLTYSHNNDPYLNSSSYFRHKVNYNQTIFLHKAETIFGAEKGAAEKANVSTSLNASIINASDPFITDNFRGNFSHLDYIKIIQRHDRDETAYTPSITDKDRYSLGYKFSYPSVTFSADVSWIYDVYKVPGKDKDDPIDEQYKEYLKTRNVPSINFRHSSFIDRKLKENPRAFHFDLGYSLYLNYKSVSTFKDGKERADETGIYSNIDAYGFVRENSDFKIGADIFRKFEFSFRDSATVPISPQWLYFDFQPRFVVDYLRKFVPVDLTTSNDLKKNRTDLIFTFSLDSKLGFFSLIEYPLEIASTQTITLKDIRTLFYLPSDISAQAANFDPRKVDIRYNFTSTTEFLFPSSLLKREWEQSYTYLSMLPTARVAIGYKEDHFTSTNLSLRSDTRYTFDRYSKREIFSQAGVMQRGYGLFFLPRLDYVFETKLDFQYDLLPRQDENNNYISTDFTSDIDEFWRESRVKSFTGSSSYELIYRFVKTKDTVTYQIFDTNNNVFEGRFLKNRLDFAIGYKEEKKPNLWFSFSEFNFAYSWDYYFWDTDYKKDRMSLEISNSYNILGNFSIRLAVRILNSQAYRYFGEKVEALDTRDQVNFFDDVADSMGFRGIRRQQLGLFKFQDLRISLNHDLDDWFLSFSYVLVPQEFKEDSFRGYYLDHKVEFEVNLKPGKDPRGEDATPLFDKVEERFSPNYIRQ